MRSNKRVRLIIIYSPVGSPTNAANSYQIPIGFKHRSVTFFLHFYQKPFGMVRNAPKYFFNRNSEHKIYHTTSDDDNK